jgi:hypothetical protein
MAFHGAAEDNPYPKQLKTPPCHVRTAPGMQEKMRGPTGGSIAITRPTC